MFRRKREKVTGGWKKIYIFSNLYLSPDIVRVVKSTEDEISEECSTHGSDGK
jgi:hypothetical protein